MKMIRTPEPEKHLFTYPEYSIVIEDISKEEADKELEKRLAAKNISLTPEQ